MKAPPVLVLTALAWGTSLLPVPAQEEDEAARHPKIRGDVYHHASIKKRPPGRPLGEHHRLVFKRGINGDDLEREQVAIYARDRLPRAAIAAFSARGIVIDPDLWIPPVPGRHPLGFHLGVVPYANLAMLADDARVEVVASADFQHYPQNDAGGELIRIDEVQAGTGLNNPRNGNGVRIAIADSGVDLSHPDLPAPAEAWDVTDGTGLANWGANVANQVTNHGTHVAGTVVGNGNLSGGRYTGVAPGATWAFYKIGNDTTSSTTVADEIEAINRAVTLGYDVFTMSYGSLGDSFMDGSGPMEQAIDAAVAAGVTVFISAGNGANDGKHDSINVAPGTTSAAFGFLINNLAGMTAYTTPDTINLIWIDDQPGNTNITLSCNNLAAGESLTLTSSGTSPRGTDARRYSLTPNIAAGTQKTYNLQIANSASSGFTPLIHCYAWSTATTPGAFTNPDPAFTIGSPALADNAIAVGAWVHRAAWTDFFGIARNFGETAGTLASFSSLGPRIGQFQKPTLVAPGSATISLLDTNNAGLTTPVANSRIIDNDGMNLNGSGPANYAANQGTSMACPMAAGVAALVIEENPGFTPLQVRDALLYTAASASSPGNTAGFGLIDALDAVREADIPAMWVDFSHIGVETGSFIQPFNTLAEGVAAVPSLPANAFPPRLRIKAGTSPETITINKFVRVENFGGPASVGP